YTSPSRPMVCMGTGCDVVRASPFAHFLGLPTPVYGLMMYGLLALLLIGGALLPEREGFFRLNAAVVSGGGFLISLYLSGVEGFVIHAWCAWCVASAITVTVFFALAALDAYRPASRPADAGAMVSPAWRGHAAVWVAAVALGAPSFYWLMRHGTPPPAQPGSLQAMAEQLIRPDSHSTGNPNAPVTIVEFGDFECPYCGDAEKSLEAVQAKYGDRIRFVFRHYPVWALHPYAEKAAEASECAADQGKFWEGAKKLYDQQADLSDPALLRYAQEMGLDMSKFKSCLASGEMAKRVRRDYDDGMAVGVRRTPTFFIGGKMAEGALDVSQFSQLIDQALAQRGVKPPETSAGQLAQGLGTSSAGEGSLIRPSLLANPGAQTASGFQTAVACSADEASKPEATLIHTPEAKALFASASTQPAQARPLFLDVRPAAEFAVEHIAGARNLPLDKMERQWNTLPKNRLLVLYESGRKPGDICAAGRAAGRILLAHSFSRDQVKVFQEGLAAWEKAGLPVEGHRQASLR
ncbi:MAG: hypothetical protein DMG21_03390, partial [Acidobacteria bacterium]